MSSLPPGASFQCVRHQVGPVAWSALTRAFGELGWSWWLLDDEDTDPGGGLGLPFVYRGGWLEVEGWTASRAARLARQLAATLGGTVTVRGEVCAAEVGPDVLTLSASVQLDDHDADGACAVVVRELPERDAALDGHLTAEVLRSVAEAVWAEVPLPLSDGPEAGPRRGTLRLRAVDPPLVCGPSIVVSAGGVSSRWSAEERSDLEERLARADALDRAARPPGLERWRDRVARRVGPGSTPEEEARLFAELTLSERSAPGRGGRVAAYKLRAPGRWVFSEAELARLGSAPGVPERLRALLTGGAAVEVEVPEPPPSTRGPADG